MKTFISLVKRLISLFGSDKDLNYPFYGKSTYASEIIMWKKTGNAEFPFETHFNGHQLMVRVNGFPADDTIYSLLEDGDVIDDFMNIPKNWQIED